MRKEFFALLFAILLACPLISAVNQPQLTVEKENLNLIVIQEFKNPAIFNLKITNNGSADTFRIYTLVGVEISAPQNYFEIPKGTSELQVKAIPDENLIKKSGFLSFEYQMKGDNTEIFKDNLILKIVPFSDLFEISALPLQQDATEAIILIKNKENIALDNIQAKVESNFLEGADTLSFRSDEEKSLTVTVNKNKTKTMLAGDYSFRVNLSSKNATAKKPGIVTFLEKENLAISESSSGWIIRKTTIKKTNEGNIPATAIIEQNKDIISRLVTISSPAPTSVKRTGIYVKYHWEKVIGPDETFEVSTTTNYTLPFIIVIIIIVGGFLIQRYISNPIIIKKHVSYVKTSGGEFALKITLRVRARKKMHNVVLTDRLPAMTHLYEKYGRRPDIINEKARILEWNIGHLAAGEERIYSYVIYSKLAVVGQFELPFASATFDFANKRPTVYSNRAFFVANTTHQKPQSF